MDEATANELERLSKKLGRLKGVDKLYTEARNAKINVTKKQVQDFVAGIGQKQVLTQSRPSLGRSATSTIEKKAQGGNAICFNFGFRDRMMKRLMTKQTRVRSDMHSL